MATKEKTATGKQAVKAQKNPVLVTTEHRGVFQGDLVSYEPANGQTPARAIIKEARCCVAWRGIKGFVALASTGPERNCKITPAALEMTLEKVTSVTKCTPEAVSAWRAEPWS